MYKKDSNASIKYHNTLEISISHLYISLNRAILIINKMYGASYITQKCYLTETIHIFYLFCEIFLRV